MYSYTAPLLKISHMAITKAKKGEILTRLQKIFAESKSVIFVNFHKLTVKHAQDLRRKLLEGETGYFVAKKTLIRKALEGIKTEGTIPSLEGEIGVAYLETKGTDLTAPAREVFSFEKKLEKAVHILGGIFEGFYKDRETMVALASIPSRQTLYAQFANLMNSPIQRLVVGLSEVAKKK